VIPSPEKHLNSTLAAFLGVRPPRKIPHPFFSDADAIGAGELFPEGARSAWTADAIAEYIDGARAGGSENYVIDALADAVLAGQARADTTAYEWLTEQKTSRGWMGTEVGCRSDYGWMTLCGICAMARKGSPALAAICWEWLDLFRFWMSKAPRMHGQRSALPGHEQDGILEEVQDFLRSGTPVAQLGPSAPPTIDRLMVLAVMPELQALRDRPEANPAWKTATEVTFLQGEDGAASVVAASVNDNTLAVLGCSTVGAATGEVLWAPPPPWGADMGGGRVQRIREQSDGAQCVIDGFTVAHYHSSIFKAVDLPLPVKGLARTWKLGSGSTAPTVVSGASATPPSAPAPTVVTSAPPRREKKSGGPPWPLIIGIVVVVVVVIVILSR